jgi:hypothetical protein
MVKDVKPGLPRGAGGAKNFLAVFLALSGFVLVLFSLKGVGISADSITYTSVSRHLNESGMLRSFDRDVYVDFPVGYPLFLAAIQWVTTLDPMVYGLFLNAVLFACLIFGVVRMLGSEDMTPRDRFLLGACVVASPALLEVYEMLWSETLFILCIGLFLITAVRYGETRSRGSFWLMVATAGLAAVTRYAGVTLIATGGLIMLADRGRRGRDSDDAGAYDGHPTLSAADRWKNALYFGFASSALLVANLVRNRVISGTVTGNRQKNLLSLGTHLRRFGAVLCEWLPPLHRLPMIYEACAVLLICGLAAVWVYWWVRRKAVLSVYAVSATFAGIYTIFILGTAMLTAYEGLDTRLLAPLYMPALLAIGGTLCRLARQGAVTRGAAPAAATIALALVLIASVAADIRYLQYPGIAYKRYVRYDIATLRHSPTLEFIKTHPELLNLQTSVYTNAPDILYLLTPRSESDYLPDSQSPEDIRDFGDDRGAYVIWINACLAYPRATLDELQRTSGLKLLYAFSDGAIYIHE